MPGVLHGTLSYLMEDGHGQVLETHSVAPGLDYPGVGPEHSFYKDSGRAEYVTVTDREALDGRVELHDGVVVEGAGDGDLGLDGR